MRLIDADELLKQIKYKPIQNIVNETWNELYERVIEEIDNAPTVTPTFQLKDITDEDVARFAMIWQRATSKGVILEPERPHGKWIKIFENPFVNGYVCPFCGHKIQVTEQFLPQITECEVCGADMRQEESEK